MPVTPVEETIFCLIWFMFTSGLTCIVITSDTAWLKLAHTPADTVTRQLTFYPFSSTELVYTGPEGEPGAGFPPISHRKAGVLPALEAVAVKLTAVPSVILLPGLAVTLTDGVTSGLTLRE